MPRHVAQANDDRYPSYTAIASRIQERLSQRRGTQARLAEALDMDSGSSGTT